MTNLKYEARTHGERCGTSGWTSWSTAAKTREGLERAMLKTARRAYESHVSFVERGFMEYARTWEFHTHAPMGRKQVLRFWYYVEDGAPFDSGEWLSELPGDDNWREFKALQAKYTEF